MDASQTPSMPESATPEKIRQLLSTFISPEKSPDVGQKSPETRVMLSRNRERFLKRVETFTPSCLSPLCCAALGWECVARDVLCCCSCRTAQCIVLPPIWETARYDEKVKEVTESLKTSHAKYCTWPEDPCPDWLFLLPLHDPAQLLSSFCSRFQQLRALPSLSPAVLHDVGISDDTMKLLLQALAAAKRAEHGGDAETDGKSVCGREGSNGKNDNLEGATKGEEEIEGTTSAMDNGEGKVSGGRGTNGTGGHDAGASGKDDAKEATSETEGGEGETNGRSGKGEGTPSNVDADSEVKGKDVEGEGEAAGVQKEAAPGASSEVGEKVDDGATVDDVATVDGGAKVDPGATLDPGATVDDVATVDGGAKVDPGATLDPGAKVDDVEKVDGGAKVDGVATVDGGAKVDSGATVDPGATVDTGATVDDGAKVDDGVTVDIEPGAVAACVLALCGWDASPNVKSIVSCTICCRRIGLWNFKTRDADSERSCDTMTIGNVTPCGRPSPASIAVISPASQQNLVSPPKQQVSPGPRVAVGTKRPIVEDASGGHGGRRDDCATPAKRGRTDADNITFHPISEHRHWCPWVCPVTVPGPQDKASQDKAPGWRAALNTMMPMIVGEGTVSTLEPTDVWKKVHRSIMSWQVSGSG